MPIGLFSRTASNDISRAHRWMQLSVMLEAGIQASAAVKTINKTKHRDNRALAQSVQLLERGQSLGSAFKHLNLLSEYELAMLVGAEKAGRVAQGLEHISRDQRQNVEYRNTLAAGFVLPKAMLLIAAIVALFIRIFEYKQDVVLAALQVSLLTIAAFMAIQAFLHLWSRDARGYLSRMWSIESIRHRSRWFQSHFEYHFYHSLNWQLQSGVAVDIALDRCSKMLANRRFKDQVEAAVNDLQTGRSISESLINQGLVLSARMKQTLMVANETGTFEKSIAGELALLKASMELGVENQIKWLPKILYVLVLWFVFTFLI